MPPEAKNSLFEAQQTIFLWLSPATALLTGLLAYVGILSSLKSIANLRQLYEDHEHAKALGVIPPSYIRICRDRRTFENWRFSRLQ